MPHASSVSKPGLTTICVHMGVADGVGVGVAGGVCVAVHVGDAPCVGVRVATAVRVALARGVGVGMEDEQRRTTMGRNILGTRSVKRL